MKESPIPEELPEERTDEMHRAKHWAVRVEREGDNILSIESNMLAGKPDFTAEDEECIRDCAHQLLSFIGATSPARSSVSQTEKMPSGCPSCGSANR